MYTHISLFFIIYYMLLCHRHQQASINARLNIIYVLDAIFAASQKVHYSGYNDLTRRDLSRILAAVVPDDPKGLVNIANTRKVNKTSYDNRVIIHTIMPLVFPDPQQLAKARILQPNRAGHSREAPPRKGITDTVWDIWNIWDITCEGKKTRLYYYVFLDPINAHAMTMQVALAKMIFCDAWKKIANEYVYLFRLV